MRLTIFTATGYGCGYIVPLSNEGHSVSITSSWGDGGTLPDIAICDDSKYTSIAEMLRNRSVRVLGPSQWSSILSTDSSYKDNVISAIGYKKATPSATGVPVTVSCWFNGQRFISKSIIFNYTKMMSGNVGCDVSSAGYLAYFNLKDSKLIKEILDPLERFLRKASYKGCFSIECVIGGEIYVKDISADINKPYANAIYENTRMSKSDVLLSVFNESSNEIPHTDPWVAGVMLSVYPYPYAKPEMLFSVDGLNPLNLKHSWLMDVTKNELGWSGGGLSGNVGYVTARGTSAQEAVRRCYRTIENIHINEIQYRIDIGKDIVDKFYKLKELGWIS